MEYRECERGGVRLNRENSELDASVLTRLPLIKCWDFDNNFFECKNIVKSERILILNRKEQAEMTRKKIIHAAEDKIRTSGYDTIKVADIAKECNMSVGNFYHYFKSLEDLFDEIDSIKFYKSLKSIDNADGLCVIPRLKLYFIEWIKLSLTYYGSGYMYYWTRRYTQRAAEVKSDNRVKLIVKHISRIVQDGVEKRELREEVPAEDIAYTIAFLIFGSSVYFGTTDDEEFVRKWSETSFDTYIKPVLEEFINS